MSTVLPHELQRPWNLQGCACAYADDFALATASLRESLPIVANAFATIDIVTGMSLSRRKCHWIHCGNLAIPQLSEWVGTHVTVYRQMQIKDQRSCLAQLVTNGLKQEANLLECVRASAPPRRALSKRLVSFKILCPVCPLLRSRREILRSKGFRQAHFTPSHVQCSCEEVHMRSQN